MSNHQKLLWPSTFLLAFLFFISNISFAITFTTSAPGSLTSGGSWDANGSPGSYWGAADVVIVNHAITLNTNIGFAGTLIINPGGSIIGTGRNISLNNGASLTGDGPISVNNYTLNSTSSANHSSTIVLNNNLTVGSGSTLNANSTVNVSNNFSNNAGIVTFDDELTVGNNLTNNNGTITFNSDVSISGKFDNNNASAEVNINAAFDVNGNIQNNSGATINVSSSGDLNTNGNFSNNSGSSVNNDGRFDISGNYSNNGGDFQNNSVLTVGGNFTQNGGNFVNDGGMLVDGNFRVNGGASVTGSGVIRTNSITNYGSINGSQDICRADDTTPTTQNGGGSYSGTTSYCTESSSEALPITLVSFEGEFISKYTIELKWTTSAEINNDHFVILSSNDGKVFKPIYKIQGAGNSNKELHYKTTVDSESAEVVYFKLKQIDFDGKSETFSTIVVKNETKGNGSQFQLYPNPGEGNKIFLTANVDQTEQYCITIFSSNGEKLCSENYYLHENNQQENIELLHGMKLKRGLYFIELKTPTHNSVKKYFVK